MQDPNHRTSGPHNTCGLQTPFPSAKESEMLPARRTMGWPSWETCRASLAKPGQKDFPGKVLGSLFQGGPWCRALEGVVAGVIPGALLQVHRRWQQGQASSCSRDIRREGRSPGSVRGCCDEGVQGLPANQPQLNGFSILGSVVSNTLQQGRVGVSEELPELPFPSHFPHHGGQVGA